MNARTRSLTWPAVALLAILTFATAATGQIPLQINYQVMLTDDADEPLADQQVELLFGIFDTDTGGGELWSETHQVTTNSIGVASVVLGATNPIDLPFVAPLWLEVTVEGEVMEPRRPLVSAPCALLARHAEQAIDAGHLGEIPAAAYALDDDLYQPGVLNDPANPLEWTKLKNVPGGFADGIDDAGTGDGHSLDAQDGSPTDVVMVGPGGQVEIAGGTDEPQLHVLGAQDGLVAEFTARSNSAVGVAIGAFADSTTSILSHTGYDVMSFAPGAPVAVAGYSGGFGDAGWFVATSDGEALVSQCWGTGTALHATGNYGYSGEFHGGEGVLMDLAGAYPVLDVTNGTDPGFADAAYFYSDPDANSYTWTIYSNCGNGIAGLFHKEVDDDEYCLYVQNETDTSEGVYVKGTIVSTVPMANVVETSRGPEAVFGVTSNEPELISSGKGRLEAGAARVEFDRLFAEAISGPADLRLTATPIGAWSALYVDSFDGAGFDVRSGAGDTEVEFHWVAVGRAAGHERRPEITIPDPAEFEALAELKKEAVRARRPEDDGGRETVRVNGR
jgi:hypothetical protein